MAEINSSSAYDVKIESILLTADRLQHEYELAANVAEVNIFENLDLPYLTGSILLVDSTELITSIAFQGTERIRVKAKINGDDTSKLVDKVFIVTDIKIVPAQDAAEVLRINMIEEHAYLSRLITVSKSYDGKPEDILSKIIKDKLDLDVLVPDTFDGSAVPTMKVVIPSLSPLDAARWIKNRIVSSNGMPYFFYSTLNGSKLVLQDLESMLLEPPRNISRPYTYGQAFNRWSSSQSVSQQARNIEAYSLPSAENMIGLAEKGVLNSTYEFIDTVKSRDTRFSQVKVSMEDVLDRMVEAGIITNDQRGPIYDNQFTIREKRIEDYNPSVLSQVTASNTYSSHANYYEAEDIEMQRLKSISRAIRYYLLKSPLEISMPGFDFLGRGEDITIGRQIILNFLKNNPDIYQSDQAYLDEIRSGKYLIYACRHIIKPEKYSVSMACVKLANQKND